MSLQSAPKDFTQHLMDTKTKSDGYSACPIFGGSNPGMRTELIHSVNEELSLICGCAFTSHASAFASVSLGRSKWNGNIGNFGIVFRAETPLGNFGRPSFTVQLNGGTKF